MEWLSKLRALLPVGPAAGNLSSPGSPPPPAIGPLRQDQVRRLFPGCRNVEAWTPALNAALIRFGITTPRQIAGFCAIAAVESGDLTALSENMDYRADRIRQVFPSRVKSDDEARHLAGNPEALAERVYGGRYGNGPEGSGDGWRFRGGGIFQLTFRGNYEKCAAALGMTAEALADAVRTPAGAALSAGWYWADRGLGHHAEVGNFGEVARLVAGAATVATTIGIDRRMERWRAACAILGAQP